MIYLKIYLQNVYKKLKLFSIVAIYRLGQFSQNVAIYNSAGKIVLKVGKQTFKHNSTMLKTEKLFTKLKICLYNELSPFESCMYNAEKCGRYLNHSHSCAVYV